MKTNRFLRGRSYSTFGAAAFVISTILFYQNCSQVSFVGKEFSDAFKNRNNGSGYGGKPDGDFYRYVPGFKCEEKESFTKHVSIRSGQATLTENRQATCAATSAPIDASSIDASIYQDEIIGYEDGIFEGSNQTPSSIPAKLVEVWCRDSATQKGIESVTYFNRISNQAVNRLYYAKENPDGTFENQLIADFPVGRVVDERSVVVRDGLGFELVVHRDQPAAQVGTFVAEMKTTIDGQSITRPTACRVGGTLDSSVWPLLKVTDANVLSFKTSPDESLIAFSSDTGVAAANVGQSRLFVSKLDGSSLVKVSSDLKVSNTSLSFSPDSKKIGFIADYGPAPQLVVANVDGTTLRNLDSVDTLQRFDYSSDGRSVFYHRYDRPAPPSALGLYNTPIDGGVPKAMNPPLSPGTAGVSAYVRAKGKVYYFCCNMPANVYSVNEDGSDLKVIPTPPLPANWYFANGSLGLPNGTAELISVWAWTPKVSGLSANYVVAVDGSFSARLPEGWLWTSTSASNEHGLLVDQAEPTQARLIGFKTGAFTPLPAFMRPTDVAKRDGSQKFETHFFSSDSTSYVGLSGDEAIAVSTTNGSVSKLCPDVSVMYLHEKAPNDFIFLGFDGPKKQLSIYQRGADSRCAKINSVPVDHTSLNSLIVTYSPDGTKLLATIRGKTSTGTEASRLYFIPLNGRAPYRVDTPVSATATIENARFLKNSREVLFFGDQIRAGEKNVFLWRMP